MIKDHQRSVSAPVAGVSGILSPEGIRVAEKAMAVDIPIMVAVAVACFPIFFSDFVISRWEGLIFLVNYIAYTLYLFLDTAGSGSLPVVIDGVFWGLIPIILLVMAGFLKKQEQPG